LGERYLDYAHVERQIVKESNLLAGLADDPRRRYLGKIEEQDLDFIIKKRSIGINELCPCKSGKKFKDCHLDEVRKGSSKPLA
ncbi:MAG: SEC-C domain-containing protein, partial [Candidatus Marinimicrobia bacterium]|nr:SEC-C domain-containing protein [Candidatus Neomarinimicrobiota bacterium]